MNSARHIPLLGRTGERQALDRLLDAVRGGQSAVQVIRGEAGIGKTALLHYCARQAAGYRVVQLAGVESEMELHFAGLHQLCARMIGAADALAPPQREALGVALGTEAGPVPDGYLVGLAVLSLLSEVAQERPLLCLIDDVQWLDAASRQVLGFVARRLLAESVAIVFAVREPHELRELARLPELPVGGLAEPDAGALLTAVIPGRLDSAVRARLLAETRGNPLAILELPSDALRPAASGAESPQTRRIEEGFRQRIDTLDDQARLLMLVAAAEPADDPLPVWRAAERLGIGPAAAAGTDGLLAIGDRVTFLHPLVRSAAYRSAPFERRREAHLALAESLDTADSADRRAWHRAAAAPGPDEAVATELELCAVRAAARGGPGAAAAFLERAGTLSADPAARAARLLAAAGAKHDAGTLDAALRLLRTLNPADLDELGRGHVEILDGQIAFEQQRLGEAATCLTGAARRLEPVAPALARRTYLEALGSSMWEGDADQQRAIAGAALAAPPAPVPLTVSDALLVALARLVSDGHAAATPELRHALDLVLAPVPAGEDHGNWMWFAITGNALPIAQELWEPDAWRELSARHERFARDAGALIQLQYSLDMRAWIAVLAGELGEAHQALAEERGIAEAMGNLALEFPEMLCAAARGEERRTRELTAGILALVAGRSRVACFAHYASAMLDNSLGRHAEALQSAALAFAPDHLGNGPYVVPELAEAASRMGDTAVLEMLLDWMAERARSDWSVGTEALVRALAGAGDAAYREAIERLGRTWLRPQLARAQLLYGEWLRREGRRVDAREQLRPAHEAFADMGMNAFAERARRELAATGETVRARTLESRDDLTPQERQIAGLARDGFSNREIGARLFLSPRTVEWHMKKVFKKLGISSRMGLREALDDA